MDSFAVVSDVEPVVAGQPRDRAFDHPPVAAETFTGFDALAGDPGRCRPLIAAVKTIPSMVVCTRLRAAPEDCSFGESEGRLSITVLLSWQRADHRHSGRLSSTEGGYPA